MRVTKTLLFLVVLGSTTVAWSKAKTPQITLIPAFDQSSPGIKGPLPREYDEVHRVSPDGKYIVV